MYAVLYKTITKANLTLAVVKLLTEFFYVLRTDTQVIFFVYVFQVVMMMITMLKQCGLWTLFLLTLTFPVCAAVEITPLSSYHQYDQLTEFMNYTSRAYPALTYLYTIGQSEQGKNIHSVYRSHETATANNQYTGRLQV